jgi:hypothetical protein
MSSTGMITVWGFEKAPSKYRALHASAFAPEWVVHVPPGSAEEFEAFANGFSSGCLERRTLRDGCFVYFGSSSDKMVMAPTASDSTQVAETVR